MHTKAWDLAIVGGGLAGLATAALAARRGLSVVVLERHRSLGGRASTDREHGFLFNRGAHALYNGGAARRVLSSLGIELRGGEPDGNGGLALSGGALHALPGGPISLLWSGLLDLSGKLETARVLARMRSTDLTAFDAITVTDYLAAHCKSPSARALLAMLFRTATYGIDFDEMSAGLALEQLRRATYDKVVYLDGGWQTVVDALAESARAAGATLITTSAVQRVERGAVILEGQRLAARSVVVAASPAVAAALVDVPSLHRASARAVPVRAACVDLGLSMKPRTRLVLGIDRPLYLSNHSAWAELAPDGASVVHLVRYLGEHETGEGAVAELEALMERVNPGYRAHLVARRVLPNMVVSNARVDAAAGGLRGRLPLEVEEVPGIYLAGDWVGHEGFLADASLASAAAVVERITRAVQWRPVQASA